MKRVQFILPGIVAFIISATLLVVYHFWVKDNEKNFQSRSTQMQEGFIITKLDGKSIRSVDELAKALEGRKGGVMLEGVYEDLPGTQYYAFGM